MGKKIFVKIILVLIASLILFTNISFADKGYDSKMKPSSEGITSDVNRMETVGNKIIGIMQVIGVAGGVITLIILGMKYMMVAPSEKADIKKTAGIYITGAVIMFSATGILEIIRKFAIGIK